MESPPLAHALSARRASPFALVVRRPVVALLVFLTAALAVYAPALGASFLWDDQALVRGNLLIRSPLCALEAFRHTLFDGNSNFYRPVQTLTYIIDYWFWGMNAFGYHLTNILIHGCNAWLLFLVLRRMLPALLPPREAASRQTPDASGADQIALAIAALWGLHPVHSAAVAYVSGRADTLAMGFCLLAWLGAEKVLATAASSRRWGWAAMAFAALLGGLCSKEIAFVWLALFGMYLFAVRRDLPGASRLLAVAAGLCALGIYLALRSLPPTPPAPPPLPPMPSRWLLMIRALGDYGGLLLFPKKLFMERQVFAAPGLANPPDASVYFAMGLAGVGMLAAFLGGALWPGPGRALRRFGAGWFLLAFLPVSNLFVLNASVAEHWLYLPSIGFLLFLAGVAVEGSAVVRRHRAAPLALAVALVIMAGALGLRTHCRSFDWMDELTFFRQTIQDGGDFPRARLGLANSYSRLQNDAEAIPLLRRIAEDNPRFVSAQINLANALARHGQTVEARAILNAAARDPLLSANDPRQVIVTVGSLDQLEDGHDWPSRRAALLDDAARRYPDSWELVQVRLKNAERQLAWHDALTLASGYVAAHWWHAPARFAVGRICMEMGRGAEALEAFRWAARLDAHDAEALGAAAELCRREGRMMDALDLQWRAVRRQPDSPKLRLRLAAILERNGDPKQAAKEMATAKRLLQSAPAPVP
jgi:tetratricopeptide (TPR) repeat protein